MISVRDDDVLLIGSNSPDPFKKFKGVHELICKAPSELLHVPAIIVEDLKKFPEAIEYIKSETQAGRMQPEIHGLKHIDYGKLIKEDVRDHILESAQWIYDSLGTIPVKWFTPWGASQPHLHEVAAELNLYLVDCSNVTKMVGRYGIIQKLNEGWTLDRFNEVIIHWWRGQDVQRLGWLVDYIRTGSLPSIGSL